MWPGFDSRTWRDIWVAFVVGSRPSSEGFSQSSLLFLPPFKPTLTNSNSTFNDTRAVSKVLRVIVEKQITFGRKGGHDFESSSHVHAATN